MLALYILAGYFGASFAINLTTLYFWPGHIVKGELVPAVFFWPLFLIADVFRYVEDRGAVRQSQRKIKEQEQRAARRELEM